MRLSRTIEINDPEFRKRLLAWAAGYPVCCVLNSNGDRQLFADPYSRFDFLIAADAVHQLKIKSGDSFHSLRDFYDSRRDWLFGFFTYDLKNELEKLHSQNADGLKFPAVHFFQPRYVVKLDNNQLTIYYLPELDDEAAVTQLIEKIQRTVFSPDEPEPETDPLQTVEHHSYIQTVNKIKEHIRAGDIYEMNYCVEFSAEAIHADPASLYRKLNELSPMPFSCFYRVNDTYAMCASPERFLAKRGEKIISQPIKGTMRRGKTEEEDRQLKQLLKDDAKERSENVMIVDLVRNDLSRSAKKGSVKVEELFGVYTFRQLHQMISTVIAEKREDIHFTDVIRHAFPMGSMTGAPKIKAMELIEEYEQTRRGLYSGSIGYISPEEDFDFNVVIRTLLYNAEKKYLSFMVGSAITANADAEKEYAECRLKASVMLGLLNEVQKT